MRDGALQGVDQLCDGGEDRAVVIGQFAGSGLCEPALDGFLRYQGISSLNNEVNN
jgi:hypothetical protein